MHGIDAWLTGLVDSVWAIPIVFVATILDGFVPPVPSETIVVALGAVASAHSDMTLILLVIVTATVGAWCGDVLVYLLGRRFDITHWRILSGRRSQDALGWARNAIDRNALGLIVAARYVPVGRVAVNLTAGSVRLQARRFLPAAALAAFAWATYTTLLGALAGRWLDGHPGYAALVGIVAGLAVGTGIDWVIRTWRGRRARRREGVAAAETASQLAQPDPFDGVVGGLAQHEGRPAPRR